jgi:tetratricopeptide (TPR) repeat protein
MDLPAYVYASSGYALVGIVLGVFLRFGAGLRENRWVQLGAVAISFGAALPAMSLGAAASTVEGVHFEEYHASLHGLLFFAAGLCHLPVFLYVALHHWGRLVDRLTSGKRGREPEKRVFSVREEWQAARRHLEALAKDPLDCGRREALACSYLALGALDAGIREYRKAAESVDSGYDHARLLYKSSHLLVETKKTVDAALPLLRRIVRLYPKSYFAAYARRVISRHEAYESANASPSTEIPDFPEDGPKRPGSGTIPDGNDGDGD